MGFRTGAYCKLWTIEPVKNTITKARISISKKNKSTGEYEQDFGGFVSFVGTSAASKAAKLKEGDRIKLGDVDVTNVYQKETGKIFTNFNIYSFEVEGESNNATEPQPEVDDGEVDESRFPF